MQVEDPKLVQLHYRSTKKTFKKDHLFRQSFVTVPDMLNAQKQTETEGL
jgi:hypothetical protein